MSTSKVQLFKEVAIIPDVKTVWDFYTLAMQNINDIIFLYLNNVKFGSFFIISRFIKL